MITRFKKWRHASRMRKLEGASYLSEEFSPLNLAGLGSVTQDPGWMTPGADPRSDRRT
jgi:hypothetical protein